MGEELPQKTLPRRDIHGVHGGCRLVPISGKAMDIKTDKDTEMYTETKTDKKTNTKTKGETSKETYQKKLKHIPLT